MVLDPFSPHKLCCFRDRTYLFADLVHMNDWTWNFGKKSAFTIKRLPTTLLLEDGAWKRQGGVLKKWINGLLAQVTPAAQYTVTHIKFIQMMG